MGRPKKNNTEMIPNLEANESQKEAVITGLSDTWAALFESGKVIPLYTHEDIIIKRGRNIVNLGVKLKAGVTGLVLPSEDCIFNGLPTEIEGYRLTSFFISPVYATNEVQIVIHVFGDTKIQERTDYGERYRDIVIPEGTNIATIAIQ